MGRTALHTVNGRLTGVYYRDNILAAHVVPFARRHCRRFRFQGDNARAQRARIVTYDIHAQNITTLPWPWLSHDRNHIVHISDMLGGRLRQQQQLPTTRHELDVALQDEWNDLNQADLGILIPCLCRKQSGVWGGGGGGGVGGGVRGLHDIDSIFTSW